MSEQEIEFLKHDLAVHKEILLQRERELREMEHYKIYADEVIRVLKSQLPTESQSDKNQDNPSESA